MAQPPRIIADNSGAGGYVGLDTNHTTYISNDPAYAPLTDSHKVYGSAMAGGGGGGAGGGGSTYAGLGQHQTYMHSGPPPQLGHEAPLPGDFGFGRRDSSASQASFYEQPEVGLYGKQKAAAKAAASGGGRRGGGDGGAGAYSSQQTDHQMYADVDGEYYATADRGQSIENTVGDVSRDYADRILLSSRAKPGDYVWRKSKSHPGSFVLCVCGGSSSYHYPVELNPNERKQGRFQLLCPGQRHTFPDLEAVERFYKSRAEGIQCKLRKRLL